LAAILKTNPRSPVVQGAKPPNGQLEGLMTQILVYQSDHGIALATDSRAVALDPQRENAPHHLEVQKLFELTPRVIAVTGGAGYGILFCRRFQRYIRQAGLQELGEILEVAPGFFRSEAESFHQKNALTCSGLDRLYVVIAGYLPQKSAKPFHFVFLASEHRADPLHVVETSHVLAIPRQVGIEYRLARLSPSDEVLDETESLFEDFLLKLANSDEDIGPPFHFVRITRNGIRIRSLRPLHP
jgi:hypothetical protein